MTSLGGFILSCLIIGEGAYLSSFCSEYIFIIITTVGPAEWVGPSVEFLVDCDIELSWEDNVVVLTEVDLGWSLGLSILHLLLGLEKVDYGIITESIVSWGWES